MATAGGVTTEFTETTGEPLPCAKPELLAPAGDRDCIRAAVENGTDAIYFGLQQHNARARAHNFDLDELPEIMASMHQRGVKGYVTLNTLIFPAELEAVETIVRRVAEAGVDAVIVQDIGLARLIRETAPGLEIHGSTQMSITSAAGVRLARELGCSRVILARELSLQEIARIRREIDLPVEVFVHGALCVAYSGQCLTSEALGGRSANRGECAQACRMPYEILCDGTLVDLEQVKYLLSPQDLAAVELVPKLVEIGVSSLKIEGRLKTPEYVATITRNYRRAIDDACAGRAIDLEPSRRYEMEMTFSRGFSTGFLEGNNHKKLVRGDYAKKRGVLLGVVHAVNGGRVRIDLTSAVKPGDGVVFDGHEDAGIPEQGGRVYEVFRSGRDRKRQGPAMGLDTVGPGLAELAFGHRDLDTRRLVPGQRVWKTGDPELTRRLRQTYEGRPQRTVAIDLDVQAIAGTFLEITGTTALGHLARVLGTEPLDVAQQRVLTIEDLREQLGRLGGTVYQLRDLNATIEGDPMVPHRVLNALRRELVARLDAQSRANRPDPLAPGPVLDRLRPGQFRATDEGDPAAPEPPELAVLCHHHEQVIAARESGITRIYLEYQDIRDYGEALATARAGNGPPPQVWIATPRIEKPGEGNLFRYLAKQGADGLLVRNAGGLEFCQAQGIPFVADFALNAANELSVDWLRAHGAQRVTASYDLSAEQLVDLLAAVPPSWLEIVIHQRIPMFLMEHCVYCAFLSPGTDKTNCGRPCDAHDVKLRDRVGMEHPLKADVGCRNTLYHAVPQTAAEFLPRLTTQGARHFRIEFLDDTPEIVRRTIELYREALAGRRDARTLWKDLKATNQYGVTRGQLAVL